MNKTDIGKIAQVVIKERIFNQSPIALIILLSLVSFVVIWEIVSNREILKIMFHASKLYAKKIFGLF